jgi:hypothetical protein
MGIIIEKFNGQNAFNGSQIFNSKMSQFEGMGFHGESKIVGSTTVSGAPKNYKQYMHWHCTNSNSFETKSVWYDAKKLSFFGYGQQTYITNMLLSEDEQNTLEDLLAPKVNMCKWCEVKYDITKNICAILSFLFPDKKLNIEFSLGGNHCQVYLLEADNLAFALQKAGFDATIKMYESGYGTRYVTKPLFGGRGVNFYDLVKPYEAFAGIKMQSGAMYELQGLICSFYPNEADARAAFKNSTPQSHKDWLVQYLTK